MIRSANEWALVDEAIKHSDKSFRVPNMKGRDTSDSAAEI